MKTCHISGFGISTAVHVGLALLLMPLLFADDKVPEEPPVLPVELSMFEPKAPEPPPPPPPKPPEKPKEKPKPKPKPDKPVEKPLPKPPEKDLRKEQEERERSKELQRQREEQQRLEDLRRQEQARAEAERQHQQAQEAAARAAAQAQNAVPVITNPRYSRPPSPPDYPRRALESGTEGTTIVRANVSPGGNVTSARVHQSSGNSSLDSAAVKAVRGWSFVPATRGGQNIESIVQVPVNFRIN
ncbi:MAG TPA: TonB family protein [Candidatus Thiothrix moscowensis]|uniref:energy transducer TonB n=1 Tax=unclassified Thiothrix TaxID=2636184 RepID=UPI0025D815C1|nr:MULTISPECIES: TonB family protein [unclassified Thiothrix]HRJ52535.1 TonB family protein [Candidatus Thiothrix moscowensis]HRJ93279.1 TonB family protein [Candidatus Thiothrix moscowensis]